MKLTRSSGILLHPTSLPGRFGIGDLGGAAYDFIDFLVASGQSLWQILPLGPTGYGDSPYQSFSAFAGNPLLVSPDELVDEGLLTEDDLETVPGFPADRVDYGGVLRFKMNLLEKAFRNFNQTTDTGLRADFLAFEQEAALWLDDYALYRTLKDEHGGRSWSEWERELVKREPSAILAARESLHEKIEAQKFYQYLFFKQWSAIKSYANERRISIIGDIPIFVAYDSADVWTNPDLFKLDEEGSPVVVAGVPPDYFSKTGQLWGNPLYDWERMRSTQYRWWIDRIQSSFEVVDLVRVDHFRGFAACWEVPAGDKTAERGRWVEVPGRELFTRLEDELGDLAIIAEDLGVITPDVEALRDDFGFPGMRILQFAFRDITNSDLPHNYVQNTVVYTGTHDNDTSLGWFNSVAGEGSTRDAAQIERERQFCLEYFNTEGKEINWDFIRVALASVADMAVIPLQDVLGLGSTARMNLPASTEGNWAWRFQKDELTSEMGSRLKRLTELYVRGREQPKEVTRG